MSSECILPGGGDSVGEGVVLVVSSPEEHTVVVTLAVEPSISRRTKRQRKTPRRSLAIAELSGDATEIE